MASHLQKIPFGNESRAEGEKDEMGYFKLPRKIAIE